MEDVGTYMYFTAIGYFLCMAIWYVLWPFGKFYSHLVYVFYSHLVHFVVI
jgi:hypothetical protein